MDRFKPSARTHRAVVLSLAALLWSLAWAPPADAQGENYTFTAGVLGTLGGSQDADPGDELDNTGFQINLGAVTQPANHLVVRLGNLGLDSAEQFVNLTDADLTYATIGGEYRYRHSYYDSGLYLALGAYRLEGDDAFTGADADETSLGLSAGATGEFPITPRFSVQAELSGHFVDFDAAQVFVIGGVGVVVHF
ncbi:MAG: hypothetical protein PVG07_08570 [Acidobacteriota bacterium]|jgi:hypothetical protein